MVNGEWPILLELADHSDYFKVINDSMTSITQ